MIKPWLEAAIALEFDAASKSQEPEITGPHARLSPLALCRNMSRSCISARSFRQITAPVTVRNFFCCRNSVSQAPSPNAVPRRPSISWNKESDLIHKRPQGAPRLGQATLISLPNRALSESGFAHDTPATLCMKRQTTHIIVIDICSLRLKSELRRKSSFQIDVPEPEKTAADVSEGRYQAAWKVLEAIEDSA